MVTEFLIGVMKKVWKWIVVIVQLSMYLMPLNCIFKISLNTNLCYIYYHNKKKEFHSSFIHIGPNLKSPDGHQ